MRSPRLLAIITTLAVSAALAVTPAGAQVGPGGTPSGGTVTGVVYQPDGITPVANAWVLACKNLSFSCSGNTTSASDGTFTLTNVAVDMDRLDAYPPSGQSQWFRGSTSIVVAAGETTNATVRLIDGGRASGTVFEPDGHTPVASGTTVVYEDVYQGNRQSMGIATDAGGTYLTPWLPPGTLTVTAGPSSIGTKVSSGELALAEGDELAVDLVLGGGGGWIVGTVTGGGGPLAGASVFVPDAGSVTTGTSGAYRTLAMPSGVVTVSLSPPYGANFLPATASVSLVAGANTVDVDLAVGGILTGSVTAADGSPIAAGSAQACTSPFQCRFGPVSGGSYTLSGLATGSYTLTVTLNGPPFPAPFLEQTGVAVAAGTTTVRNMSFAPGIAPPSITSILPNSAQACTTGCSPVNVTVNGSAFDGSSVVWWDAATPLTPTSQGPTTLSVAVPPSLLNSAATHQVTVSTSAGASSALPFFVTETAATIQSSDTASGTDPTASTGTGGATVTASADGEGTVTVAQYASNPVTSPAPTGTSNFFDINVPTGSTFTSLTVVDCALDSANTSHLIYWWSGTEWAPLSNQAYDAATGCVTMTFTDVTAPMIAQLVGTVFADTPANQRTLSVGPANTEGVLRLAAGDWLSAGYEFKPAGKTKKPTTVSLTNARLVLPVSCGNGATGKQLVVNLAPHTYSLPAGSTAWMPTNDTSTAASFQGAAQIADPCNGTGITTTTAGATLTATVSTLPAGTPLSLAFHYRDSRAKGGANISCANPSTNPPPGVKSCKAGWSTPAMA